MPSLSYKQWVDEAKGISVWFMRVTQTALGHNIGLSCGLPVTSHVYCCLVLCLEKWQPYCNFRLLESYRYRHLFRLILWGRAALLALILSDQSFYYVQGSNSVLLFLFPELSFEHICWSRAF